MIIFCINNKLNAQIQTDDKIDCIDSCNYCDLYNLTLDYKGPYIYLTNGNKNHFQILQEPTGLDYDISCEEVNLDNEGSDELVIFWENRVYGSGGGSTTGGVQIYNLDSGTRIFNELTFCSIESFHRPPSSPAYTMTCRIDIKITDMQIFIGRKRYEANWIESLNYQNGWEDDCISSLEQGVYSFSNDTLKLKKE